MRRSVVALGVAVGVSCVVAAGCSRRVPPATAPVPAPSAPAAAARPIGPPPPPARGGEPLPLPPQPIGEDAIAARSLDDMNRDSPLRPVFYPLDSAELDDAGRAVVAANSELLRKYPTWVVTIEGHCDERGTAEYNLALGERRAAAVQTYLVSLGVAPGRIMAVSYGKEYPFDSGRDESAWAKNRRAEFVITAR